MWGSRCNEKFTSVFRCIITSLDKLKDLAKNTSKLLYFTYIK